MRTARELYDALNFDEERELVGRTTSTGRHWRKEFP